MAKGKKFSSEDKHTAMVAYAEGKILREIADSLGCHLMTVFGWKKRDEPQNWEQYRELAIREKNQVAVAEARRNFAQTLKTWQDNSNNAAAATNVMLRKILAELKREEEAYKKALESDPSAKPPKPKRWEIAIDGRLDLRKEDGSWRIIYWALTSDFHKFEEEPL